MTDSRANPRQVVQNIRRDGDVTHVSLSGEVDLHRAGELREALLEVLSSKPAVTVIDMKNVDFMDSSGLATLIEALQLSRRNNGQLKLVAMQQRVRNIFEISRLESIFQIYDSEAEALA